MIRPRAVGADSEQALRSGNRILLKGLASTETGSTE